MKGFRGSLIAGAALVLVAGIAAPASAVGPQPSDPILTVPVRQMVIGGNFTATVTDPDAMWDDAWIQVVGTNADGFTVVTDVVWAPLNVTVSADSKVATLTGVVPASVPTTAARNFVCVFAANYDWEFIPSLDPNIGCVEIKVFATAPAQSGWLTSGSSIVRPGGTLSYAAKGFWAGETVSIVANSTPVNLGTTKADANGNVSGTVTIPSTMALGAHTLVLTGQSSGVVVNIAFTVGSVPGASTDVVSSGWTIPVLALGATGAVSAISAGLIARRRREVSA
jgi:hypothetical protein